MLPWQLGFDRSTGGGARYSANANPDSPEGSHRVIGLQSTKRKSWNWWSQFTQRFPRNPAV